MKLTRRELLKGAGIAGAGLGVGILFHFGKKAVPIDKLMRIDEIKEKLKKRGLDERIYEIKSYEDLAKLSELNYFNKKQVRYILTKDIECSSYFNPIGNFANPFRGIFDGNGYTISNLKINKKGFHVGLFGYIQSMKKVIPDSLIETIIANLNLENIAIEGEDSVGGLVGVNDRGIVINCKVNGMISGKDKVGGLIGVNNDGIVLDSYSNGVLTGNRYCGGIIGFNSEGFVKGCSSDMEIKLLEKTNGNNSN